MGEDISEQRKAMLEKLKAYIEAKAVLSDFEEQHQSVFADYKALQNMVNTAKFEARFQASYLCPSCGEITVDYEGISPAARKSNFGKSDPEYELFKSLSKKQKCWDCIW